MDPSDKVPELVAIPPHGALPRSDRGGFLFPASCMNPRLLFGHTPSSSQNCDKFEVLARLGGNNSLVASAEVDMTN